MTDEPKTIRVDSLFGHVELRSRWVPCGCGDPFCGHFMNWSVHVDRYGLRTTGPEWRGVGIICGRTIKPPRKTWFQRLLKRFLSSE